MTKPLTFPKSRRLAHSDEFERVRIKGKIVRGSLLSISWLTEQESFRAGFVTSRRVGNAVKRNAVRRRLREIVRRHQHDLAPRAWVVTIARTGAVDATFAALEHEWLRLAKRASILPP